MPVSLGSRPLAGSSHKPLNFLRFKFGAQVEQVGEHPGDSIIFVFEMDAYPEAKILAGSELRALHRRLKSWVSVANEIGASEAFARQNAD